ncbi:MAG: DUF1573 domain-containing protein [Gallionellaceae bacterium]
MKYSGRLRADPLVVLIILIGLGISYFNFKAKPVEEIKIATPTATVTAPPAANIAPLPPTVAAQGHLVFEKSFFDFGAVVEGEIIKHTFKFKNDGAGKVKIVKTETSCGCTTASAAIREYAAGEVSEFEVVIDTKDKKGIVVKTVTLALENNDVPAIELSLAMKLEPPPHPKIGTIRNINTEDACKTCHLESGVGQTGVFLYHRVCAQCHGKKGIGGFGRAFNDAKWQKVADSQINKVIHQGLPEKGMPSFVEGVKPPLTEEQIASLIEYIRGLKPR